MIVAYSQDEEAMTGIHNVNDSQAPSPPSKKAICEKQEKLLFLSGPEKYS